MPLTLLDILPDLLGRIEEQTSPDPLDGGVQGPIFWNLQNELLVELVDAMFEAALITGVIQAVNIKVTLPANQTYFPLSATGGFGNGSYPAPVGLPLGVTAALRMKQPWAVRKVSLKGLSDIAPNWQREEPSESISAWFPLGVSGFGIWPALSVESDVVMDFLVSPVNQARPYQTYIPVPFLDEYADAFPMYAAVMLRAKELAQEAEESEGIMASFLQKMKELSIYQARLDSLIRTQSSGSQAQTSQRTSL